MKKPLFIARQGRRPSGFLGWVVALTMAYETERENRRTLRLLDPATGGDTLEIGFGHGKTLRHLAGRMPTGRLAGVDFSEVMLRHARRRNADLIAAGRVELHLCDSARMPFDDDSFDFAYSVHTVYFWPDPARQLSEIRRVLRPGGRFVLAYRSSADRGAVAAFPETVYRFHSTDEIKAMMWNAGFSNPRTITEPIGVRSMSFSIAETAADTLGSVETETAKCA